MSNIEINNVTLSGIVIRDPESRIFGEGERRLLRAKVSLSVKTYSSNNSRMEVDIIFWGRSAENAVNTLSKGDFICVNGILRSVPNSQKFEVMAKTLYSEETKTDESESAIIL